MTDVKEIKLSPHKVGIKLPIEDPITIPIHAPDFDMGRLYHLKRERQQTRRGDFSPAGLCDWLSVFPFLRWLRKIQVDLAVHVRLERNEGLFGVSDASEFFPRGVIPVGGVFEAETLDVQGSSNEALDQD